MPADDTIITMPSGGVTAESANDPTIGGSTGNGEAIDAVMQYDRQLKPGIIPTPNRVVTPNMFVGASSNEALSHQTKVKRIDTGSGDLTACYAISNSVKFGIAATVSRQFVLEQDGQTSGAKANNAKRCATFSQLHQNNGLYGTIPKELVQPPSIN